MLTVSIGGRYRREKMNIYYELNAIRRKIPYNTYKTILGQLNAGDVKGAETGIKRLKEKLGGKANGNKQV